MIGGVLARYSHRFSHYPIGADSPREDEHGADSKAPRNRAPGSVHSARCLRRSEEYVLDVPLPVRERYPHGMSEAFVRAGTTNKYVLSVFCVARRQPSS